MASNPTTNTLTVPDTTFLPKLNIFLTNPWSEVVFARFPKLPYWAPIVLNASEYLSSIVALLRTINSE